MMELFYKLLNVYFLVCLGSLPAVTPSNVRSCYACATQSSACVEGKEAILNRMDCQTFTLPSLNNNTLLDIVQHPVIYRFLEKLESQLSDISEHETLACLTYEFQSDATSALRTCIPATFLGGPICEFVQSVANVTGLTHGFCHVCTKDDCNWSRRGADGSIETPKEEGSNGVAANLNSLSVFGALVAFLWVFATDRL